MPITNEEAIRFSNEQIRPLCESFRALKARVDAATVSWFATVSSKFPNDSSVLEDGRVSEGVSILTGADVNNVMTQLLAFQAQLNAGGVASIIEKPCVRTLVVS